MSTKDPYFHLTVQESPGLSDIYPNLGNETVNHPFQPYPFHPPKLNDLALYIHSSGSTGLPKAVAQIHLILTQWASFRTYVRSNYSRSH